VTLFPIWTMKNDSSMTDALDGFADYYKAAKKGTKKCHFFGWAVGDDNFISRESYEDAEGVIIHIKDVIVPLSSSLETCNVDLHFSGPAAELKKIQAAETKQLKPTFWTADGSGLFYRERLKPGIDTHIAVCSFAALKEGKMKAFKQAADEFVELTKKGNIKPLYIQFAYREKENRCFIREGFDNAEAFLDHLDETNFSKLAEMIESEEKSIIGAKEDLDMLRGSFGPHVRFLQLDADAMQLPSHSRCVDITVDGAGTPRAGMSKKAERKQKHGTLRTAPSRRSSMSRRSLSVNTAATGGNMQTSWIQYIDDESGAPYWYNAMTGETTWEEPKIFVTDQDALNYSSRRGSILSRASISKASDELLETIEEDDPLRVAQEALDDNPTVRRLKQDKDGLLSRMKEMKKRLKEQKDAIRTAEGQKNTIEAQFEKAKKELNEAKVAIDSQAEIQRKEAEDMKKRVGEMSKMDLEKSERLKQKEEEAIDMKQQIDELERDLKKHQDIISALKEENSNIRNMHEKEIRQKEEALKAAEEAKQAERSFEEEQLVAARLKTLTEKFHQEKQEMEREKEKVETEKRELQDEVVSINEKLRKAREDILGLEKTNEELRSLQEKEINKRIEAEAMIEKGTKILLDEREAAATAKSLIGMSQDEHARITNELKQLQSANEKLMEVHGKEKKELMGIVSKLQEELRKIDQDEKKNVLSVRQKSEEMKALYEKERARRLEAEEIIEASKSLEESLREEREASAELEATTKRLKEEQGRMAIERQRLLEDHKRLVDEHKKKQEEQERHMRSNTERLQNEIKERKDAVDALRLLLEAQVQDEKQNGKAHEALQDLLENERKIAGELAITQKRLLEEQRDINREKQELALKNENLFKLQVQESKNRELELSTEVEKLKHDVREQKEIRDVLEKSLEDEKKHALPDDSTMRELEKMRTVLTDQRMIESQLHCTRGLLEDVRHTVNQHPDMPVAASHAWSQNEYVLSSRIEQLEAELEKAKKASASLRHIQGHMPLLEAIWRKECGDLGDADAKNDELGSGMRHPAMVPNRKSCLSSLLGFLGSNTALRHSKDLHYRETN